MAQQATVTIRGASGASYPFQVFPWGKPFQRFGAVYSVLKKRADGRFDILYIGQTADMSERFDDHHKELCFRRHGRTHIGVHPDPSEVRRRAIETDLIRGNRTPCNG
jgi:hypothetical protein